MTRQAFSFEAPKSLEQLWLLLDSADSGTRFLAGGTDLLVKFKRKQVSFSRLVDLKNLGELQGIVVDAQGNLHIGALTTLTELGFNSLVSQHSPILSATALKMASAQVRNRATIGGNLCNGAPSADLAPPLLVLGASLKLIAKREQRLIPISSFFTGPGQTLVQPDEVLAEIVVPQAGPGVKTCYLKQGLRQAMDIAITGVAVKLRLVDGICQEAAIALGSVAPMPIRVETAEQMLLGQKLDSSIIAEAAALARAAARPISDVRASADYRMQLVQSLVIKCLEECS